MPAVLTLAGRRVVLTALVDTGNTLTDPATGRPVMVAEGEKVSALFPAGKAPAAAELRDPVAAVTRSRRTAGAERCRLLPYQAVGVECGMLLALRLDAGGWGEDYGRHSGGAVAHTAVRRRGLQRPDWGVIGHIDETLERNRRGGWK